MDCQETLQLRMHLGAETLLAEVGLPLGGVHHQCCYLFALLFERNPTVLEICQQPLTPSTLGLLISLAHLGWCQPLQFSIQHTRDMWLLDSPCMNLGSSLAIGNGVLLAGRERAESFTHS